MEYIIMPKTNKEDKIICQECGQKVKTTEKHNYNDCINYKNRIIDDERLFELAKLYGDNYTYKKIVKSIKRDIITKLQNKHREEIAVNRSEVYDKMNELVKQKDKEIQKLSRFETQRVLKLKQQLQSSKKEVFDDIEKVRLLHKEDLIINENVWKQLKSFHLPKPKKHEGK